MNTLKIVERIKSENADFEWYPTHQAIIDVVKNDIAQMRNFRHSHASVMDIGAGDGRVLMALTDGIKFAIEKSRPLIEIMDRTIFIAGTDFHEQQLIDKKVDVVFCNPPYSEFAEWMCRIIKEANAEFAYFVVPKRWQENEAISAALKLRSAKAEVIFESDFYTADRAARIDVHVIRVSYRSNTDAFTVWFNETFQVEINKTKRSKFDLKGANQRELDESLNTQLVAGSDLISALHNLYCIELDRLLETYRAIEKIPADLLMEMDVNLEGLMAGLQMKIEGLKDLYWKKLFHNFQKITDRLATKSRKRILDHLMKYIHVDFTPSNAYAIMIWVLKNANLYLDDQIIDLVEHMTEKANVQNYKSNQHTFGAEHWRYRRAPENLTRYKLDYRVVLECCSGLMLSAWEHERNQFYGLKEDSFNLLNDILTVAGNIGFDVSGSVRPSDFSWISGKAIVFTFFDHDTSTQCELMQVRAYKKGTLHIKFNQAFMCRLNVEFGRLKGWLKSASEAVDELEIGPEEAMKAFQSNRKLDFTALPALPDKLAA